MAFLELTDLSSFRTHCSVPPSTTFGSSPQAFQFAAASAFTSGDPVHPPESFRPLSAVFSLLLSSSPSQSVGTSGFLPSSPHPLTDLHGARTLCRAFALKPPGWLAGRRARLTALTELPDWTPSSQEARPCYVRWWYIMRGRPGDGLPVGSVQIASFCSFCFLQGLQRVWLNVGCMRK